MGGQRKVKSTICSVTCESQDDMQKTRQLSVAVKKLDKVSVYVSNDIIVFKINGLGCWLFINGFQVF
jgi:hypothetical protein